MILLLFLILAILLMPVEVQEGVAQALGMVVTNPLAPYFGAGALGALVVVIAAHSLIWNSLSYSIYLADVDKAKENHQRRRR